MQRSIFSEKWENKYPTFCHLLLSDRSLKQYESHEQMYFHKSEISVLWFQYTYLCRVTFHSANELLLAFSVFRLTRCTAALLSFNTWSESSAPNNAMALVCFERAKFIDRAKVSQWLNAFNKHWFSAQTTGTNEHAENQPFPYICSVQGFSLFLCKILPYIRPPVSGPNNVDPFKPHIYIVNGVTRIYICFSNFCSKTYIVGTR